jgi:hypothetical protein
MDIKSQAEQKLNPQAQRILKKLQEYEGRWVPLPEILSMFIGSYTRRMTEIRRAGFNVALKDERVNGQRHTSYRLVA